MVTVAMSAMMRNNPIRKTVVHRKFENDQVLPSLLCKLLIFRVFFGLHGVAASSSIGLYDRVLTSAVTHFFKSSYVLLPFQLYSVKFFQIGLRVSLFMHALLILLIIEVALHDRSAIVLVSGILAISCSLEFL